MEDRKGLFLTFCCHYPAWLVENMLTPFSDLGTALPSSCPSVSDTQQFSDLSNHTGSRISYGIHFKKIVEKGHKEISLFPPYILTLGAGLFQPTLMAFFALFCLILLRSPTKGTCDSALVTWAGLWSSGGG